MIFILVGGSAPARATRRKKIFGSVAVEELLWEKMSVEEIGTLASTASLLGDARAFLLLGALTSALSADFISLAKGLASSPHMFVFEEDKVLKKVTDALAKNGASVETLPESKKTEPFNVFGLANIFATRDKKKCWLSLLEASRAGIAPEAVAGMLHWKVRDLIAKGGGGKFSVVELKKISRSLVSLYHDSHRGVGDLELLLERFALTL